MSTTPADNMNRDGRCGIGHPSNATMGHCQRTAGHSGKHWSYSGCEGGSFLWGADGECSWISPATARRLDDPPRHDLKVVPPYMAALLDGSKTFEVRRNDRNYQRGDLLVLREWHPAGTDCRCDHFNQPDEHYAVGVEYLERSVSHVFSGDPRFGGIEPGYVVLALAANFGVGGHTT